MIKDAVHISAVTERKNIMLPRTSQTGQHLFQTASRPRKTDEMLDVIKDRPGISRPSASNT
jgi:hypothetical protein